MNLKRKNTRSMQALAVMVILLTWMVIACAGVNKAPIQQNIAKAEAAINNARNSDARTHAPLELTLAEEKLSKARTAFEKEEYQEADWLAEEAITEAKLAEAKARSAKAQATVKELEDTIQTLQNEIERQRRQ
ncbi:MAG: DUF4398 domain-containing protein [Deltaproteobacteria bacterium]|nr:DUF4398 domain-containing protein [Deltaproteobacteria bacterium]